MRFPPSPPTVLPLSGITSLFPLLAFLCLLLLIYLSVYKKEGTLVVRSHQLPVTSASLSKLDRPDTSSRDDSNVASAVSLHSGQIKDTGICWEA